MEADHYQRAIGSDHVRWQEIPNLGRTLSSMITLPVTADPRGPGGDLPGWSMTSLSRDTGSYVVTSYLSPTLNYHHHEGLKFAVSLDEESPGEWSICTNQENLRTWESWVSNNINLQSSTHHIAEPGVHTLKWWRVDAGIGAPEDCDQ